MQKETTPENNEDTLNDLGDALFDGHDDTAPAEIPTPEKAVEKKEAEAVLEETEQAEEAGESPPEKEAPKEDSQSYSNDGTMPYGAYAAEKQKRQDLEMRATKLEEEREALKAQYDALKALQPKPEAPDLYDDPKGHAEFVQYNTVLNSAKVVANTVLKADEIAAAESAFIAAGVTPQQRDAGFKKLISEGKNPYVEMVNWHKGEQAKVTEAQELEEYRAWKASQAQVAPVAPVNTQQVQTPQTPLPPDVAATPSAGLKAGAVTVDDVADNLFGR